jgi:hypothetical protein
MKQYLPAYFLSPWKTLEIHEKNLERTWNIWPQLGINPILMLLYAIKITFFFFIILYNSYFKDTLSMWPNCTFWNFCIPGRSQGYFGFGPVCRCLRSHPSKKWSGSGHFPGGRGPKTTQIKHFFIFFIVWLKNILPHTLILFNMCRTIFVLHLNAYFVAWGVGPLENGDF